ncbi:MAG: hypothetical protein N2663_07335 [Chlorobi bacterium]|nr:hypothetical protein [Chlorobiota bacterium]
MTVSQPRIGTIVRLWFPLALTWAMMAAEGPIVQSIITRLPETATNLAAFGVALSIAFIIESPIIMLLSAATAYVKGAQSYVVVKQVALGLSAAVTGAMVLLLIPPIYRTLAEAVLHLPRELENRLYWCIVALTPWPGAIGVRRFYQGILIAARMNKYVAAGTLFRLGSILIGGSAILLMEHSAEHSAVWVSSLLSIAVIVEMLATLRMARRATLHIRQTTDPESYHPTPSRILRLYLPLAATSTITMGMGPIINAFMARLPAPIESLATFPVVDGLVFQFRSPLFAYQEVAIWLFSRYGVSLRIVRWTGYIVGSIATVCLMIVTLPTVSSVLYGSFPYRLDAALLPLATCATAMLLPLPLTSAAYSIERAALIVTNRVGAVTLSTLIESGITVAILSSIAITATSLMGLYAATIALAIGKIAAAMYLVLWARYQRS